MKLLTRTGWYYLGSSFLLFIIAGIVFYQITRNNIDEDVTENLLLEKNAVETFVRDSLRFPASWTGTREQLAFERSSGAVDQRMTDTLLFNVAEDEFQVYRQVRFPIRVNEEWYAAAISQPMYESEDLLESILQAFALVALLNILFLFALNRVITAWIWKPFYSTLSKLSGFVLSGGKALNLPPTGITEFDGLNQAIANLTGKMTLDYGRLKEFTANASHEIQTPLAVAQAKLELLLQGDQMDPDKVRIITDTLQALIRLSKLNESLLLLSRIENQQFQNEESFRLDGLITEKLDDLDEWIKYREIAVQSEMMPVTVKMNRELADILMSNLLGNALRYSPGKGIVAIHLTIRELKISNLGEPLKISSEQIFERFSRSTTNSGGSGIGLAIVKSICELYGIQVGHDYQSGNHILTLIFTNPK